MMLKLAAFSLGRRGYLSYYSKILTPLLVKSASSVSVTTLQSVRKTELLSGTNQSILRIPFMAISSEAPGKIILNPEQKQSVLEQLKLFDEALSTKSMVFLLGWVGRTVYRRISEMQELEKESSNQGSSVFIRMLNCIADNISELQHRELAVIAWSLGRIKENRHPLMKACEKEIISRGLGTFDYKSVSQIALGFSLVRWGKSSVFEEMENAVLRGDLQLADFDVRGLAQTVAAFAITENGSPELFEVFSQNILSREFSTFQMNDLAQFAWAFAKKEAEADQLFEKIEAELFRRRVSEVVKGADIAMLLWSFAAAKQGSEAFFSAFVNQILKLRNLNGFKQGDLSDTVWALGKAGVTNRQVFDRLELEVERRGIQSFSSKNHRVLMEGLKLAGR